MPEELSLNLEDQFTNSPTPAEAGETPEPQQQQAQPAPSSDGPQLGGGSSPTPPASLPESWTARAQQMGLPLEGIDTPEKFTDYLLDQFAQSRPYADYGRSALTNQGAQVSQPQTDKAAHDEGVAEQFDEHKYFSEAWTVPELSPGAQMALKGGAFETDDRGFIVAAKGYEQFAMPYLKEINDYQQAKQVQNESFAANPVKFMAEKLLPYFEHKFSDKWQSAAQEQLQNYQQQNYEQKFIEDNKAWLYTADGKAFTPEGQKFRDTIQQLRAKGINDPETLADWGMKLAGINPSAAAAPAAPQAVAPAGTPAAPDGDTRARDEHGRFLPAGTPAPKPTKQESFLDQARRKAANGSNQGSFADTSGVVVANDGELDNMFTTAWREYAGAK